MCYWPKGSSTRNRRRSSRRLSGFDCNVHRAVAPAALEAATAAFAGKVVDRNVQNVLARFAELRGRRRLAVDSELRSAAGQLFDHWLGWRELDHARAPEHGPGH